jgi:hypothetical protein
MLVTWLDLAFVGFGLAVAGYALRRRPRPPDPEPAPPATRGELLLTLVAAVPAAVGPNVLVVALTPGMPGMPVLVRVALLPSLGLLLLVWVAARRARFVRLVNRIETGVWVGFVATAALHALRLVSFSLGLLPGHMPRMFGVLIFDRWRWVRRCPLTSWEACTTTGSAPASASPIHYSWAARGGGEG